ncbi:protein FAR1-RELATED SEQUENCE 5-like [Diospyros lotus]|uniref:protein FAR1-RELATED SEQUENCE 5-like n=1 Tax=Diospyros lotus TaxID=55363 RepID=UPI0022592248|nr:protein FAR1-RELATED SEQUENCE 5-like [Diospyros lotus]
MSDIGNPIVLAESFEDNEETFVNNEEITENNECTALEEESDLVPKVGMKFNEEKDVFEFYKRYAYDVGFPVKRRSLRTGDDGVLRLYRCNRQLSEHVKRQLEVNDIAGIPLHKSYNSAVVEAGGYENQTFVEKDCRNYIDQVRRLRLGEGDAAAIQAYFSKMQAFCPGFYFSVDLDEDGRLKNVFWADNRCRQAFKEFGDVVTFDTTYLTNRYDMPFAPFVGVNHHGQSTLFGCGIISNEDTRTFVWLFRTWLECMEDQGPSPEEFEQNWNIFIEKYALHDNDWLSGLYKE